MYCTGCAAAITPGMEITPSSADPLLRHCPYCLHVLENGPTGGPETSVEARDLSVGRFVRRQNVRGEFVDRLLAGSADGVLHCPLCEHRLNKDDEFALRHGEHFRCHHCSHDLAHLAYREAAYREEHWLPIITVVGDLVRQPRCSDCAYLGAVAKACQIAMSNIPKSFSKPSKLLDAALARPAWRLPDCDWSHSCAAVDQYRQHVAPDLALL